MSTWYRVAHTAIEVVEVESHTDKTVKINGHRRSRHSDYDNYFPTRAEAVKHILQRAAGKVGRLEFQLELARKDEAAAKEKYADELEAP